MMLFYDTHWSVIVLWSIIFFIFIATQYYHLRRFESSSKARHLPQFQPVGTSEQRQSPAARKKNTEEVALLKELYHKLQNLEDYPDVLPGAWKLLRSMLDQAVLLGRYKATTARSILAINNFDPRKLEQFVGLEFQDTMNAWEAYVGRRKAGGPRESFPELKDAHRWLKNLAPLNYIDGAWVCRVHKITTPFALRPVTKAAWQTYSEEMGDGDLEKNHVFIYRKLMEDIKAELPASDNSDFTNPRHGIEDLSWRGATAHLLVSLFPNDFLPEILGFNLHFEALTTGSLTAMKELAELGISAEYFTLHVGIDNADSGHSAMALATVIQFMELVQKTGLMDYDEAWKRVQAGYLLSQNADSEVTVDVFEQRVAGMLQKKASLARKIHCSSRVKIGERSLSEWFTSEWTNALADGKHELDRREEFLSALADARPWVQRGNSSKSLLMRELAWKGRMFGAFTQNEVELMRTWIDSLKTGDGGSGEPHLPPVEEYDSSPPFAPSSQDPATFHPALALPLLSLPTVDNYGNVFESRPELRSNQASFDVLLPLWFAHPCLLENMVNSPHQMANPLESRILQILRIELAYKPDAQGVAGMDEHLNTSAPDLIGLGLVMIAKHGLPRPECLADVLAVNHPSLAASDAVTYAYAMLSWAMRPRANAFFLIGLSRAFLDFEMWVANQRDLLPQKEQAVLHDLVRRKSVCFEASLKELASDTSNCQAICCGYQSGRNKIEGLLGC